MILININTCVFHQPETSNVETVHTAGFQDISEYCFLNQQNIVTCITVGCPTTQPEVWLPWTCQLVMYIKHNCKYIDNNFLED